MASEASNPAQAEASGATNEETAGGNLPPLTDPNIEDGLETASAPAKEEAAATAPGPKTKPPEDAPHNPRRARVSLEDYEQMKAKALAPPEPKPPAEAAAEEKGEVGTTKEEVPEAAPAAAAVDEPPSGDETVDGPDRIRLGGLDAKDRKFIAMAKDLAVVEKIPFADALARLTGKTSVESGRAEARPSEDADAPKVRGEAEIQADIDALDAEFDEAGKQLDTSKIASELRKRERALNKELADSQRVTAQAEQKRQQAERTQFDKTAQDSWAQARKFYPTDDVSFKAKMEEISDRMENAGNTLVYQADSPLTIAHMAANELKIAPRDPNAPPVKAAPASNGTNGSQSSTPTRPAAIQQRAVVRSTQPAGATPASGAARTTQGTAVPAIDFTKIKSVDDYEKVKEKLGLRM